MTPNQLIRQYSHAALAYVPVSERAAWFHGWRRAAKLVRFRTLETKLKRHVNRLRLAEDMTRYQEVEP